MIEESGVSDSGLGTAGSKIFVGGLDRSVDEGTTRSARGLHFPVIRSEHPIVGFSLTRWTPSARAGSRVRTRAPPVASAPNPPTAKPIAEPLPPPRSQPPGVVRNFFSQFGPVVEVLVMRDPHNHQSRGFGFITFQREDSAGIVLQNRYHDMLGKRVEVKSAVPRGQAPPPQRGPPRSSQGYGYGQPRGGHGPGGAAGGYGYGGGYGNAPGYAAGNDNPWGSNPGFNGGGPGGPGGNPNAGRPGASAGGYGGDKLGGGAGGAGDAAHGWTEHTAPEGYVYYYNARSGVSQWERPMELDFPMSSN